MRKITILVLVFALLALVGCGADEPSSSTPPQETAPAVESVIETPKTIAPEPESIVESSLESTQSDLEPIEYIPQYTTTDTSEDALIQLVKDTITINRDRMEAEHITPAGDDNAQLGEWLFVHNDTLFADYNCVNILYLTHFLSYGLFDADIAELDNWNLSEPAQRQVFNAYFDVKYTLEFDDQDTTYQALIGSWEGEYIVLDMIIEGDIDLTPQPTMTPEAPQSNSSASGTTPAPQAPTGGNSGGSGGGGGYVPDPEPAPSTPAPAPEPTPAPAEPAPQAPSGGGGPRDLGDIANDLGLGGDDYISQDAY